MVSLCPGRFLPGERAPDTHWIGDLVGPRAGLDDVEKRKFLTLLGLELRPLGRPACSQSLTDYAIPAPPYIFIYIQNYVSFSFVGFCKHSFLGFPKLWKQWKWCYPVFFYILIPLPNPNFHSSFLLTNRSVHMYVEYRGDAFVISPVVIPELMSFKFQGLQLWKELSMWFLQEICFA
jgi:hypothetical protein